MLFILIRSSISLGICIYLHNMQAYGLTIPEVSINKMIYTSTENHEMGITNNILEKTMSTPKLFNTLGEINDVNNASNDTDVVDENKTNDHKVKKDVQPATIKQTIRKTTIGSSYKVRSSTFISESNTEASDSLGGLQSLRGLQGLQINEINNDNTVNGYKSPYQQNDYKSIENENLKKTEVNDVDDNDYHYDQDYYDYLADEQNSDVKDYETEGQPKKQEQYSIVDQWTSLLSANIRTEKEIKENEEEIHILEQRWEEKKEREKNENAVIIQKIEKKKILLKIGIYITVVITSSFFITAIVIVGVWRSYQFWKEYSSLEKNLFNNDESSMC